MPLVASVSEHSPTSWANYFLNLNIILVFVPLGFYFTLVHKITLGKLFLAIYAVLSVYFSSVMVRLVLILAPVVCILAGIAVAEVIRLFSRTLKKINSENNG
jgi:dolichyl-diphosphooligosaccharide--protein glycosyltransferase